MGEVTPCTNANSVGVAPANVNVFVPEFVKAILCPSGGNGGLLCLFEGQQSEKTRFFEGPHFTKSAILTKKNRLCVFSRSSGLDLEND